MRRSANRNRVWIHLWGIAGECPACGALAHAVARVGLEDGFAFWAHDETTGSDWMAPWCLPGSLESMIAPPGSSRFWSGRRWGKGRPLSSS